MVDSVHHKSNGLTYKEEREIHDIVREDPSKMDILRRELHKEITDIIMKLKGGDIKKMHAKIKYIIDL